MNYLRHYCNLIRKAENRTPPEGYTEKHHTFPKSIFGNNNRIVILTGREHYIAHALLEKVCVQRYGINHWKTIKMTYAFWCMNSQKYKNTYLNSHLYEYVRTRRSILMTNEKNHMYGKKLSDEMKLKISKSNQGKKHSEETKKKLSELAKKRNKNPMFGKRHSEETKKKISELNKGRKVSEDIKEKLSKRNSGKNNPYFGKKHSLKVREKMSGKNHPKSILWKITFDDGRVIEQCGLTTWAQKNGYVCSSIRKVAYGKFKKYKDIVSVEKLS